MSIFRTPRQWYDLTIGKSYDTNHAYGDQCWDYFDYFCREIGFTGSRHCSITNFVGDLWLLRDSANYHYYTDFDYITNPNDFKTGDWIFWSKHVAMYYDGKQLGQNQPNPYVTLKDMNWNGILGAMRWKGWESFSIAKGSSDVTINNHRYILYRQDKAKHEKFVVIGAGLNQVKPFEELTYKTVYTKAGGANFYQMKKDIPDQPYGMTYGDVSSPCTGMYQNLPNQDSTLFYDAETKQFGDCAYHEVDRTHNVFSPSLVYPNTNGHFEYARMVGYDYINNESEYCFVMEMSDGYTIGRALDKTTPKTIADDFMTSDMIHIAFLDGGGSAQYGRWNGTEFEYVGGDGRPLPSVCAIIRDFDSAEPTDPIVPEPTPEEPPTSDDSNKEETPMEPNEKPEITPIPNWKDPDEVNPELNPLTVILLNLANLFKVKSILTFAIVGAYLTLLFLPREVPHFLETLVTMVVGVYFGTQIEKKNK